MKSFFLALISLSIIVVSCSKQNVPESVINQTTAPTAQKQKIKYTRDFIIHDNGKYDCSTPGKNCNVKKADATSIISSLSILNTYLDASNSAGYFQNQDWQVLFPELEDEQVTSLQSGFIKMYKKESEDETSASYVLSNAVSSSEVTAENTINVWQY